MSIVYSMPGPYPGRFTDALTWENFKPVIADGQRVTGYFDNREDYGQTCAYLGAEIDYEEKKVMIYLFTYDTMPITENEITDGDGILELNYGGNGWADFIQRAGTFEDMEERIPEMEIENINIPGMEIESINIPAGSANAITYNNIVEGNRLVNFRGNVPNSFESGFGRYYKNTTIPGLQGRHPITRGQILNRRTRRAHIVPAAAAQPARAARRRRGRKTRRAVNRK